MAPVPSPAEAGDGRPARSDRVAVPIVVVALAVTMALGTWLTGGAQRSPPTGSKDAVDAGSVPSVASPTSAVLLASTPTEGAPIGRAGQGRHVFTVGGVPFSVRVTSHGWEAFDRISLNKSIVGPQGAEAMLYWSAFPDDDRADPCPNLSGPTVGPSRAHLAAAVASAPGTELVGASDATVGGRPAEHVELTVQKPNGCAPGFFFTWKDIRGGAFFPRTAAGHTIEIWIVDVRGTHLVFATVTTRLADRGLEREIGRIVRSIRFLPPQVFADMKLAERFMHARSDHDIATAMSLLAKDGATARMQNGYRTEREMPFLRLDPDELALALEVERLYGVRYISPECRWDPDPVIRHAPILCTYRMDNTLQQILGYPPVESSISIGVGRDGITHLSFPWLNVSYPSAEPPEFAEFVAWIGAEHPEAGQVYDDGELFRTAGQELVHILTRRSVDLLTTYFREYERSVTG